MPKRRDGFRAPWDVSPFAPFMPIPDGALGESEPAPAPKAAADGLTIVVDTREQTPLPISGCPTVRGTLHSGDYAPLGWEDVFSVERKSLDDLVGTVIHSRARFERELARLMAYRFRAVFVCAPYSSLRAGRYRSRATPQSVIASIDAFAFRYRIPFFFWENASEAAERLVSMARHFIRHERHVPACPPPPVDLSSCSGCGSEKLDGADG